METVTLRVGTIFISLRTLRSSRFKVWVAHRKGRKDRKAEPDIVDWLCIFYMTYSYAANCI